MCVCGFVFKVLCICISFSFVVFFFLAFVNEFTESVDAPLGVSLPRVSVWEGNKNKGAGDVKVSYRKIL